VLCRSAQRCAELLEPIHRELERQVLASDALHTDDTTVTLKESKVGGRRQARIWIYRDLEGRQVFDFTESRARDGPTRWLGDYTGYVIADAYPACDAFCGPGNPKHFFNGLLEIPQNSRQLPPRLINHLHPRARKEVRHLVQAAEPSHRT